MCAAHALMFVLHSVLLVFECFSNIYKYYESYKVPGGRYPDLSQGCKNDEIKSIIQLIKTNIILYVFVTCLEAR